MNRLNCDGWCEGANPVSHIGSKGYVYCQPCAVRRRQSGYERTRALRKWEMGVAVSRRADVRKSRRGCGLDGVGCQVSERCANCVGWLQQSRHGGCLTHVRNGIESVECYPNR